MRINGIFHSIQGEGVLVGVPMVFIRLQGCNLRCNWCDTAYAQDGDGGEPLTIKQVVGTVRRMVPYQKQGFRTSRGWICITGGEPLFHSEELLVLIKALHNSRDYFIEVETNGSFEPPVWSSWVDSWVVDIKCPSSGVCGTSKIGKWFSMREKDQVKFVVSNAEDLDFVRETLKTLRLCAPTVLVSPAAGVLVDKQQGTIEEYWNREWLREVAEFCKEVNARFSLQIHKIVYGDKRGV